MVVRQVRLHGEPERSFFAFEWNGATFDVALSYQRNFGSTQALSVTAVHHWSSRPAISVSVQT